MGAGMTTEPAKAQRVGNMRERVTLLRQEGTPDGYGGFEYTYIEVATVWARVEPVKADEQFIAGGIQSITDVLVHIRHRDDVVPTWRLEWQGRQFNITGITNLDERTRFLVLDCTSW